MALVPAAVLCLEPLARLHAGTGIASRGVWLAEIAVGIAVVVYVLGRASPARAHRDLA